MQTGHARGSGDGSIDAEGRLRELLGDERDVAFAWHAGFVKADSVVEPATVRRLLETIELRLIIAPAKVHATLSELADIRAYVRQLTSAWAEESREDREASG